MAYITVYHKSSIRYQIPGLIAYYTVDQTATFFFLYRKLAVQLQHILYIVATDFITYYDLYANVLYTHAVTTQI